MFFLYRLARSVFALIGMATCAVATFAVMRRTSTTRKQEHLLNYLDDHDHMGI